jgi:hypothetical protein
VGGDFDMSGITLTVEQLMALDPCEPSRRRALFRDRTSMNAREALEAGASISDLLWVAGRLGRKDLCVQFALACAQQVAHLNPDPRVQKALDAAQNWLDNPDSDSAYAAYAATRAAAYAAAYAAYAAADSAAYSGQRQTQKEIFLSIFC